MERLDECGQDNALAGILGSIAHELGHYYQWVDDKELDEEGAEDFGEELLDEYAATREHP